MNLPVFVFVQMAVRSKDSIGLIGLAPQILSETSKSHRPSMVRGSLALRNDRRHRFRPSIGVIASFESSMPSMQLTLSATTSVPSGFWLCANTSTPQSMQS